MLTETREEWLKRTAGQLGLDEQDILEIAVIFFQKTSSDIAVIQAACDEKDVATLARLTHGIKGAARNMGFTEVGDKAEDLEHAVRKEAYDLFAVGLAELNVLIEHRREFVG